MRSADRLFGRPSLRAGIGALAAILTPIALLAQQPEEPPVDTVVEEIVVTGSRIARRDATAPSPITTVDRSVIETTGQPTLEETLNQMPQITPDFGRTSNNPGDGTSRINLRGLGSNRTLVLVNGRRLAPSGVGNSVDINNLPQVLVDRIEIITGGATTVYGSDAVAGVVNFILRNDFDGIGLDASVYVTEQGDSEVYDLNAAWGHSFANGRGNITLFAGALDRGESFAADREFTSIPWSTDDEGNLFPGGSSAIPEARIAFPETDLGDGNPVQVKFTPDGVPVEYVFPDDLYNFAPVNYLQIPLRRYSGGLLFHYDLTDRYTGYAEITLTRNESGRNLAPVPLFAFLETNLDNPVLTPEARAAFAQYVPTGPDTVGFFLARRMEEFGFRALDATTDYSRIVAGIRGEISAEWDFDVWATYTEGEEQQLAGNDGSFSRLQQGLFVDPETGACLDPSNGCVPLNLFGRGALTAEMLAFLMVPPYSNKTSRTQQLVSGYVRGELGRTWAGPISVAFGAEWRNDDGSYQADEALFTGDSLGYLGDSSVVGEETVTEVYAEALIPLAEGASLAHSLSLEIGGRYSEYGKAGSADTWKAGGAWEPVENLRFRAMWQRSVRAPDLVEAFQQVYFDNFGIVGDDPADDPCSASADPIGRGNVEKCVQQGLPRNLVGVFEATEFFPGQNNYGGNPGSAPEVASTTTLGVVFTGFDKWTLSIDYFDLEVEETIREPDVVSTCFNTENTSNFLCDRMRREEAAGYNVVETDNTRLNLGITRTKGFDTQIGYATDLPSVLALFDGFADLSVDMIWSHTDTNSIQEDPLLPAIECAGYFGFPCFVLRDFAVNTLPKNRITANARYVSGDFDLHLTWRWIEGTDNALPIESKLLGEPPPVLAVPRVGSKNYFDLGMGYLFNDNVSTRLNVSNLFDTEAAFMADGSGQNNTDSQLYDLFGRSYQLSLSLRY